MVEVVVVIVEVIFSEGEDADDAAAGALDADGDSAGGGLDADADAKSDVME